MAGIRNILVLLLVLLSTVASNRVLELSDRFLEVRNNGVWLVMVSSIVYRQIYLLVYQKRYNLKWNRGFRAQVT
ncbi:hypothetical protein X975_09450, partial [Stegodyphus mimosarum]